jgi:hypothetical protein
LKPFRCWFGSSSLRSVSKPTRQPIVAHTGPGICSRSLSRQRLVQIGRRRIDPEPGNKLMK